jgi:hypothetical protein
MTDWELKCIRILWPKIKRYQIIKKSTVLYYKHNYDYKIASCNKYSIQAIYIQSTHILPDAFNPDLRFKKSPLG